jgi:hypothetical protein
MANKKLQQIPESLGDMIWILVLTILWKMKESNQ